MDVQKRRPVWVWALLLVALVFVWWYLRPEEDEGASNAQLEADRAAAVNADPDDILVDLRDDATPAQVAAIQRDLGIELTLVDSQEAPSTKLYRVHVDAAREQAVIAALAARPEVEIAEPDSIMALDPAEVSTVPTPVPAHEG